MRYIKTLTIIMILFVIGGCTSLNNKSHKGSALQGTETAIVGLYLDKNGYPHASIETVKVFPGQKIIFAGPEQFDIFFKDQKSPIDRMEIRSNNGLVILEIPKDIFERENAASKTRDINIKEILSYRYGIRVNGKVTDPGIDVGRR